ncbi:MAG: DUF4386 domain-containing protein, partial [Candidatus Kapaibacterium sp.]
IFGFKMSIILDLIMILTDITVAWALYMILLHVNKRYSLLMTLFRLVMAVILALNLLNLMFVAMLLSSNGLPEGMSAQQLEYFVMLFLNAHGYGYDISLIFFGLHLLMLGYIIIKSGFLPGIPGWMLLAASIGYITDSAASIILPDESEILTITAHALMFLAVIAEITISFYLISKAGKIDEKIENLQNF